MPKKPEKGHDIAGMIGAPKFAAASTTQAAGAGLVDIDGDGVEDKDTDGDEIPDEVEEGLDALLEAAACESDPAACESGADDEGAAVVEEAELGADLESAEREAAQATSRGKEEL